MQQAVVSCRRLLIITLGNHGRIEYLDIAGSPDRKAIEQFPYRLRRSTLGLRLPAKQIKAGSELRDRLKGHRRSFANSGPDTSGAA